MSIAKLDFQGKPPTASVVAVWLQAVEDEPLWIAQAAFKRAVPPSEQQRIWKAAMGTYMGFDEAREVLHVGS